jgi:hypothetical protein
MLPRYAFLKSIKLLLPVFIVFLLVLVYASAAPSAFSQLDLPNNELKLGVRTTVAPVKMFCDVFKNVLQEQLENSEPAITVKPSTIVNQYKWPDFTRYAGLLLDPSDPNYVDIECGPNSESSGQLPIKYGSKTLVSEEIAFSAPFYETGIKLLLKRELAQKLSSSSPSDLEKISKASESLFFQVQQLLDS